MASNWSSVFLIFGINKLNYTAAKIADKAAALSDESGYDRNLIKFWQVIKAEFGSSTSPREYISTHWMPLNLG